MEAIVSNRVDFLTPIFLFFTLIGELNGYILVVSALYVTYNKKIGYRLALVAATSSTINHLLKIIIRNPRPFVTDGSYVDKWGPIPDPDITVTEFSTPSGHAMGAASFWGYLYSKFSNTKIRALFIFLILMIGLSRPYLGVHYVEDIILGWLIGFLLVYQIVKNENKIENSWNKFTLLNKVVLTITISVTIWVIAGIITNWTLDGQTFATNAGFVTGFIIGRELELIKIKFDPKSSHIAIKLLRFLITVILTLGMLQGLDIIVENITVDNSPLGFALRYVRYSLTGFTAIYLAPWVFVKIKLVNQEK